MIKCPLCTDSAKRIRALQTRVDMLCYFVSCAKRVPNKPVYEIPLSALCKIGIPSEFFDKLVATAKIVAEKAVKP